MVSRESQSIPMHSLVAFETLLYLSSAMQREDGVVETQILNELSYQDPDRQYIRKIRSAGLIQS